MGGTGPTKAEITKFIVQALNNGYGDVADYVSFRGKNDSWWPTEAEISRSLMSRSRKQLLMILEFLTKEGEN